MVKHIKLCPNWVISQVLNDIIVTHKNAMELNHTYPWFQLSNPTVHYRLQPLNLCSGLSHQLKKRRPVVVEENKQENFGKKHQYGTSGNPVIFIFVDIQNQV